MLSMWKSDFLGASKAIKDLKEIVSVMVNCPHCRETLTDPYLLPCGHTVCIKHVFKVGKTTGQTKPITCKICGKYNRNYRAQRNELVKNLVDIVDVSYNDINSDLLPFLSDFDVQMYDNNDSQDSRVALEKLITKCRILKSDPYMLVYDEINELMNNAQVKKELNEDNSDSEQNKAEAEKIIKELEAYRNECREHLNTLDFADKRATLMVDEIENQLNVCFDFLKVCESNKEDTVKINEANNRYIQIINPKIESFIQNELFLNKLNYYKLQMFNI
jgi:hypothetical protein